MIATWFKKSLIVAVITAMGLSALPLASVYAQSPTPVTPTTTPSSTDRLQNAWSRQQKIYARIGTMLGRVNGTISKIQTRLDDLQAKGKDVSSIQTALDAFSTAIKNVQPIYTAMQAIVQTHAGFDASGNVTDPVQARQTVQSMRTEFQQLRQVGLRDARQALRQAIQAFRQANSSSPTPTPSSALSGVIG